VKAISIRIGYTWDGAVHDDARWKRLRALCESAGRQGLSQAAAAIEHQVSGDEDDLSSGQSAAEVKWGEGRLPGLRVERIRAVAGRFAWASIRRRIDDADIVLFDYTPIAKPDSAARTSDNVWLELGYAWGKKDEECVFLTHADSKAYRVLPSDLNGLIVGWIPNAGESGDDRSLRAAIAGAVKRLALERAEQVEESTRTPGSPGPERLSRLSGADVARSAEPRQRNSSSRSRKQR
jgi:hypothetical protein